MKRAATRESDTYLDGGWGWIVMIAAFSSLSIIGGVAYGFGVLLPEWMNDLQSSTALTSFVGSTTPGMICISGVGGGLCYVSSIIIISEYFKAKRSIALGVSGSGVGCGSFIFPLLMEYLIENYGWRGLMLILGGISCNFIAFGLIMYPVDRAPAVAFSCIEIANCPSKNGDIVPPFRAYNRKNIKKCDCGTLTSASTRRKNMAAVHNNLNPERDDIETESPHLISAREEKTDSLTGISGNHESETYLNQCFKLLQNGSLYVMMIHNLTFHLGMMIAFGLAPLKAVTDDNMTSQQGALLVSIMGFSNLLGRLLWGYLAAFKIVNISVLFIVLRLSAGVSMLFMSFSQSFGISTTCCSLVGLTLGYYSIYPVVLAELFGDQQLTIAFGYLEIANGLGCIIGPFLGGWLFDIFNTYTYSFIAGGCALALGILPFIALLIVARRKSTRQYQVETVGNSS